MDSLVHRPVSEGSNGQKSMVTTVYLDHTAWPVSLSNYQLSPINSGNINLTCKGLPGKS